MLQSFSQIIVISSFLHYRPLTYKSSTGLYTYPDFANVIGWGVALSSMLMIPGYAIYYLWTKKGTMKQVLGDAFIVGIVYFIYFFFLILCDKVVLLNG